MLRPWRSALRALDALPAAVRGPRRCRVLLEELFYPYGKTYAQTIGEQD